jgi:hypothetical protein
MSDNFRFDTSSLAPYVAIETRAPGNATPKTPAPPEAERVAVARERALQWRRDPENQLFPKPQSYFEDFYGIGSSRWDADFLANWLRTLEAPSEFGAYFSREGAFRHTIERFCEASTSTQVNCRNARSLNGSAKRMN